MAEGLGFSREVGAFLAGVTLASTPYRDAIGARLATVRDFLLLFFFIDLGSRLDISQIGATLPLAHYRVTAVQSRQVSHHRQAQSATALFAARVGQPSALVMRTRGFVPRVSLCAARP